MIVPLARATAGLSTAVRELVALGAQRSIACGLFAAALVLSTAGCSDQKAAQHVVKIPWALGGKQVVADFHMHTRFSDGAIDMETLVRKAYVAGCQAVAVTDHSDRTLKAGTQEYLDAIAALRKKYPQRILIGGLEWNVPAHASRVHMGVLFDPSVEKHMLTFKQRFEQPGVPLTDALGWLVQEIKDSTLAAFIYNHPSRHGESDEQVAAEWISWRRASDRAIGFEGGPGHQNLKPNGAYAMKPTEDRWDPAIARIGGAWDQLLDRGETPWGALASSDYHKPETEFTPCEFSRTVLNVPDASASGVLKALHAGSFWGSQGRFLDYLLFTATTPGLEMSASPGEVIRVPRGAPLQVRIVVERFADVSISPLTVEVIGNCKSGKPEQLALLQLTSKQTEVETSIAASAVGADGNSCYLRARVRGTSANGEAALAYVNPIRIRLEQQQR